jgi:hypothetical protein
MRRGLAYEALGRYELALTDLQKSAELDPGNEAVQQKVRELRLKLGISEDGRIREVHEPKVKVVDETEPPPVTEETIVIPGRKTKNVILDVEDEEEVVQRKPQNSFIVEEEVPPKPQRKGGRVEVVEEKDPNSIWMIKNPPAESAPKPKPVIIEEPITKPRIWVEEE